MLKRFMTWLLRQLQGLMGALNGKRSGSPTPGQDFRDSAKQRAEQPSGQPLGQSSERLSEQRDRPQVTGSSRATVPIVEHLPSKPSAEPDNRPANDLTDATLSEPDTHRRLDAAAAAPTNIETVTPNFPTNVSELLSSPLSRTDENLIEKEAPVPSDTEEAITPATSVRSLKRVDDDSQLPGIHDVLPAIEPATLDEPDKVLLGEPDKASPSKVSPSKVSIETSEQIEKSPDITEPDIAAPEPIPPDGVEQAVLFSFDITEQAVDARGDEPLAKESIGVISDSPEDEDVPDDEGLNSELAEPAVENTASGEILIDVLPTDEAPSAETASSESLDSKVETLPYPWSLPVPTAKQQPAKETQPENAVPAAKAADVEPATVEPVRAIASSPQPDTQSDARSDVQSDTRPIKNGVVKLLFTLKEGNFHGYIAPDDGSKDILFHQKYINADIFAHLERGVPVTASVKYIEGKAYATHVDLL